VRIDAKRFQEEELCELLPSITYRSRASGVRYTEGGFVDGANYVRDACTPREPAEVAQVVGDSRVAEREHQKLGGWSCGAYRRLERAVE
jgi:hypothetical protein